LISVISRSRARATIARMGEMQETFGIDLEALIERAPDGIFVADAEGRYTYVNEAGCRLLGYAPEERDRIVGRTIMDLVSPEDVERLDRTKARMQRGDRDVGEWRLRRKDGTRVPVEVTANILPNGQWQGFVRDISERKAHEAERSALLDQTESDRRWLQAVLDTMPLGVILYRPDGHISFNRRTEGLLGMSLSPSKGPQQYAERVRFADGAGVPLDKLPVMRAFHGETLIAEEYQAARPDGTRVPVLASAAPLDDAQGRRIGAVAVFQDVSERMRMEEAIRKSERLLQAVFDILPVGVWIADAGGRIVSGNPAGERVWAGARYVPIERYGEYKGWWVDTGKPIAASEWALARALTKGETSLGELVRIQCFDGSFKTIINSAAPLRDAGGAISGAIVVNEDITALHEAQEKQRASEQLLRTVIDLLPVGLYIADREGRLVQTNPAGERIWQGMRYVGPERYGEYKAWWVDSGEPIAPADWAVARALRTGETSRGELIRIQCFDGSFKTVINWAAPIRSDAGEIVGAVAVNEDVTSMQHTQEQLRAAVRAREEILATVTHDLRNPLAGLMMAGSAVELKARELPGGEPVRELAATLMDMTRRMSGMVDDLLAVAVSRTGGGSMLRLAPVSGSALLARAADAARPLVAREALQLAVRVAGELPTVHADADRILRVFANLLDNALKFTEPAGCITLGAEPSMGGVRYCVANSGPALPAKEMEAMFRPFWQAGRDRRGAGLGLAICRSIVEAHGGTIWAEPAEGQRVRICFVIPRQPSAGERPVSSP
jgi:PAS domain S-box-containing protein